MTHDGRNDGELRIRRGGRERRWGAPEGRVATVAAVATLAIVLSGCGGSAAKAKATPQTKAAPTATTEPYGVMAPNPNAPGPKDEIAAKLKPIENPNWISQVTAFKSLDVAEFNKLPQAMRLKVVWDTDFEIASKYELGTFLDTVVNGGEKLWYANPVLTTLGPDSTGQEVLNANSFQASIIYAMKSDLSSETINEPLDQKRAQQMLSGVGDQVGDKSSFETKVLSKDLSQSDKVGKIIGGYGDSEAVETSQLMDGKDANGDPIQYKLVVVNSNTGSRNIVRYNLVSLTDAEGQQQYMYLEASSVRGSTLPAGVPKA